MKKNSILTFLFACIPGAGQMYYGYMRRGLSTGIVFWLSVLVGMLLPPLLVLVPVIWMYAFFDTYDLIRYLSSGSPKTDDFLWGDRIRWDAFQNLTPPAGKLVGWGLIIVGGWLICAQFIGPILSDLLYWLGVEYADYYLGQVPTLVVAVVLVWLGLRMLRRSKNQPTGGDLPPYPGDHDSCGCGHDHDGPMEQ